MNHITGEARWCGGEGRELWREPGPIPAPASLAGCVMLGESLIKSEPQCEYEGITTQTPGSRRESHGICTGRGFAPVTGNNIIIIITLS